MTTALGDLRDRVAGILDGIVEDGAVHAGPVDSVTPPAYMLVWGGGSWLTRITMCAHTARLQVICVAARIDPEPGYEQLEELTVAAILALEAAKVPVETVDAPLPMELGGLTYQTARITLTQPVTLET
jgi:hypothetical protein